MRGIYCCAATVLLLVTSSLAHARGDSNPSGCWLSQSKGATSFLLSADGTFAFQGETGRWLMQGNQIWLLGPKKAGTKWRLKVDKDVLTLDRPEDFKYMGRGKYFYFQMTDPKTVYLFKRAPSLETCKPPGKGPKKPAPATKEAD